MRKTTTIISIIVIIIVVTSLFFLIENNSDFRSQIRNLLFETGLKEKPIKPYSELDNKPFVYYANLNEVTRIFLTKENFESKPLPNNLVIKPGTYTIFGNVYDLKNEGLYRFIYPEIENQQRIVYNSNVDALLSSVAWIYSHGNSDDNKSTNEINKKALNSKIFGTCATLSHWIQNILENQGVKSRVVQTLTLDEWNTYDNGHTMIEVYREDFNKWILYDLDNNAYFSSEGMPLSLIEFLDYVKEDNYEINYIASDIKLDVSNFLAENGYEYAFFSESILSNERNLRDWYSHIIQVILIGDVDNNYYFFDLDNRLKVEKYSSIYKYLNKKEFLNKFYN
ncbi:MAG: transglutaminase domain-containing protein [Nitrosopumilaceae archaeon]